jgi:hypothetical protein
MDLKPLAVASCCVFALSFAACWDAVRLLAPKAEEEEPWKRDVLAARIQLPAAGSASGELSRLLDRAATVPGVEAVAAVDILPGVTLLRQKSSLVIRHEDVPNLDLTDGFLRVISPGYFRVMSISLLQGRDFSMGDFEGSPPVVIVDAGYAKRVWPGQDPLGKRMLLYSAGPWATVVGVVQDGPNAQGRPELYIPYKQYASQVGGVRSLSWFVLARITGDPKAVAPALSRAMRRDFQDLGTWLKKS